MVSAIVLAAGLSARMEGDNKLLLPFKGKTILTTVVENILTGGIEEVIVVTGNNSERTQSVLKHLAVTVVYNTEFKSGMTTSIQSGVSIAKGDGFMICPGDMPFVTSAEYLQLALFFEKQIRLNKKCICIAEYDKQRGNPVIFSAIYKREILNHSVMEGCKEIVLSNLENVYSLNMRSRNVLKDIDTRDDYAQALL